MPGLLESANHQALRTRAACNKVRLLKATLDMVPRALEKWCVLQHQDLGKTRVRLCDDDQIIIPNGRGVNNNQTNGLVASPTVPVLENNKMFGSRIMHNSIMARRQRSPDSQQVGQ